MKKEDAKYILDAIEWMNENTTVASVDMETYGNLFMNSQCLLMDVVNGVEKSDEPALNTSVVGESVCPNCNNPVNPKGIFFCSTCESESTR